MSVLIETTIGEFVFDLYTEERPRSCLNFLKLCKMKYYNYCLFHSVRRNFIAQSGDPTGSGRGGEAVYSFVYGDQAKYFDLELKPRIKHRTKGTISFVNNGNDMHGSQFFITLGDGLDFLDGKHTVFGQLAEGADSLEKLNGTICDDSHRPYQDVRITHTIILDDPFDDPKELPMPDKSPEPTKEQLESGRIGADEDLGTKGKSKEDIQRELDDKELKIGTKILETVGDINDADEKPPENVLFVCKLNPFTNADDLKIIFSKFGKILSCEIIKDHKTGDSLCYGFVEFKEVEACEKAYFKMNNVLIDDRRIHVDFCQSVAKLKKWHKSSTFRKTRSDGKSQKTGYELKDKSKKEKEKYSMIFDDVSSTKKTKKEERKREEKDRPKKKYHSDSDADDYRKSTTKTKKPTSKETTKESRKRTKSSSLSSESESDEPLKKTSTKKQRYEPIKDKVDQKKRENSRKYVESDLSSDEDQLEKKKAEKNKKKSPHTQPIKKMEKKEKKDQDSDSEDSDREEKVRLKMKEMKKKISKYSESDSEEDLKRFSTKRSKQMKSNEKKKHYSSSETEDEDVRERKRKLTGKKSKAEVRKKRKSIEDDDTEEYTDDQKKLSSKKKKKTKTNYSSDDSSGDNRRRSSKLSRSRRYSSSEGDDRKRTSRKSSSAKKPSRKRDASDHSDASN